MSTDDKKAQLTDKKEQQPTDQKKKDKKEEDLVRTSQLIIANLSLLASSKTVENLIKSLQR